MNNQEGVSRVRKGLIETMKMEVAVHCSPDYENRVSPAYYHETAVRSGWSAVAASVSSVVSAHVAPLTSEGQPVSVIDIAAGTGILTRELKREGYRNITATDLSGRSLSFLRERIPDVRTVESDMNRDSLPHEAFDAAVTLGANRFISDIDVFSRNVYGMLKPGGVFVWPIFIYELMIWKAVSKNLRQPTQARVLQGHLINTGFEVTLEKPQFSQALRNVVGSSPSRYLIARKPSSPV